MSEIERIERIVHKSVVVWPDGIQEMTVEPGTVLTACGIESPSRHWASQLDEEITCQKCLEILGKNVE